MKIYFVKYLFSIFHKIWNTPAIEEGQMMVKIKLRWEENLYFDGFAFSSKNVCIPGEILRSLAKFLRSPKKLCLCSQNFSSKCKVSW